MKTNSYICKIDNIEWVEENNILIEGYCYIENHYQYNNASVKKSIIIENGHKKYMLPLKNIVRTDLFAEDEQNCYRMCGFSGVLDLGYINSMDCLSEGDWVVKIHIINDGIEINKKMEIDSTILNITEKEFVSNSDKCIVKIKPIAKDGCLYFQSSKSKDLKKVISENAPSRIMLKGLKNFNTYIRRAVTMELYSMLKLLPIKENTILFLSESRRDLSGNFKFVYDEIVNRGGYNIKTILKKPKELSFKDKIGWIYDIATSKYILLDDFYPMIYDMEIRKEAELVQLWHACGAFKTFGFSRLGKDGGPKMRSSNHRNYTKAIVSSENIKKHYAEGFGISEDKVFATGIPRTDIFFDDEYKKNISNELINKYPAIKGKKVIMFAPTFRGNGKETAYYDFDKLDIDQLYQSFCKDYVLIVKLHPFINKFPKIDERYKDFVIDLTCEREINDLLFISDILITDYSSVCFEFSLLNKPMIFFAYDMEEYIEKRDFYYPYEEFVPGPIAKSTEDIVKIIKTENYNNEKLNNFKNRFFSHVDGKSTKRVVDLILSK